MAPVSHPLWQSVPRAQAALARAHEKDREAVARAGVPARVLRPLARELGWTVPRLAECLAVDPVEFARALRDGRSLVPRLGAPVVTVLALIGLARELATAPAATAEFDAGRWVADWLTRPLPALGGIAPGRALASGNGRLAAFQALGRQVSGAYG